MGNEEHKFYDGNKFCDKTRGDMVRKHSMLLVQCNRKRFFCNANHALKYSHIYKFTMKLKNQSKYLLSVS